MDCFFFTLSLGILASISLYGILSLVSISSSAAPNNPCRLILIIGWVLDSVWVKLVGNNIRSCASITTDLLIMCTPSGRENGGALKPALLLVSDSVQTDRLCVTETSTGTCMTPLDPCWYVVLTLNFSIFSAPPATVEHPYVELSVLRDCLCVSYAWNDNIPLVDEEIPSRGILDLWVQVEL